MNKSLLKIISKKLNINSTFYSNKFNYKKFKQYCNFLLENTRDNEYYNLLIFFNTNKKKFFKSIEYERIKKKLNIKIKPDKNKNIRKILELIQKNISKINYIENTNFKELYKLNQKKIKMDKKLGELSSKIGEDYENVVAKKLLEIIKSKFDIENKQIQIINNVKIFNKDKKVLGEIDHILLIENNIVALFEDKLNLDDIGYAYKQLTNIETLLQSNLDEISFENVDKNLFLDFIKKPFNEKYFIVTNFNQDRKYFNLKSSYLKVLLVFLYNIESLSKKNLKYLYKKISKKIVNEKSPKYILENFNNIYIIDY